VTSSDTIQDWVYIKEVPLAGFLQPADLALVGTTTAPLNADRHRDRQAYDDRSGDP